MHDKGNPSGDVRGEAFGERSPEGQRVTYEELGRIRGIGRESAVKLVQRKRWRRTRGNDGPPDWLTLAKSPGEDIPPKPSPHPSPVIAVLTVRAERAEADRAIAALQAERERADRAEIALSGVREAAERRADSLCANDDETPAPFEFRLGHRRMTSWLCPTQMAQSNRRTLPV
jgi:hypothetical protein